MIGGGFQHETCSSALNKNKHIEWCKDGSANISFHIDNGLTHFNTDKSKDNYGWLLESSAIIPTIIEHVKSNLDFYKSNYKMIFTHDDRILQIDPSFFKYTITNAMPWIQNRKIYEKSKNVSVIMSNKKGKPGYNYRLNFLNTLDKSKVDHFGIGFDTELPWIYSYNNITESGKLQGLMDYRFSFAFENDNYKTIFCEKLTDCFATGTIPIFWGTPDIDKYFNKDGIIMFNENIRIKDLSEDFYIHKLEAVKDNFERAISFPSAEDYIYENYLK